MNHEQGFLQAIVDHPDDDTARLVYADWLDERGHSARAELIRVQCELARTRFTDERTRGLERRERELLEAHQAAWRSALPVLEGVTWEDFRRGFVEAVRIADTDSFLHQAPVLFAAAPVREMRIVEVPAQTVPELAASPYLARLTTFGISGNPIGPDVATLIRSPHLGRLECLLLCNNAIGDPGVVLGLGLAPELPNLRELFLGGNDISDAGVEALAALPQFRHLTELDLRDNRVGDRGIQALAVSPYVTQLTTLYLVNNRIGDVGAAALASLACFSLAFLYLNYNHIGDPGAQALAISSRLASVIELDLRNNVIGDAGGWALARSPYLDRVQQLWLTGNHIRHAVVALRERFGQRVRV